MKRFAPILILVLATAVHAAPPTDAELEACIGAKGESFAVFAGKLKQGMKPAEVAAIYRGADKLDKFKFATIKAKGCAGAKTFAFHYQPDPKTKELVLYNTTIELDPKLLRDEDLYRRLAALFTTKYGPKSDRDVATKLLIWNTEHGQAMLSASSSKWYTLKGPLED